MMMRHVKWLSTLSLVIVFAAILGCAGTGTRISTSENVTDGWITAKVKAALIEDPVVKATEVSVETYNGTVQLSGFVSSEAAKSKAFRIARSIQGVTGIKNDILIK